MNSCYNHEICYLAFYSKRLIRNQKCNRYYEHLVHDFKSDLINNMKDRPWKSD